MTDDPIELPVLVNGRLVRDLGDDPHVLSYQTGARIVLPRLGEDLLAEVLAAPRKPLADVHLDDITIFLDEVGRLWGDPTYEGRRRAVRWASRVTGYSPQVLEEDYTRIARSLNRAKLYDLVDADLGDSLLLDDWVPRSSVYLKAHPKGRVLHLMVGNVPLAGLFTVVRSVLTKNSTVAKLPSRDPVSSLLFAATFADVDPDHPITRSLSVVYWPGGSDLETRVIEQSDLVCAWGQGQSIASIKKRIPADVGLLEFGPKESLHFIGAPVDDVDNLAMRAAYDISVYEQEACFSPQRMFVEGDAEEFADALATWLDKLLTRLPPGFRSPDKLAHLSRSRVEASFEGCTVRSGASADWTVVVVPPDGADRHDHPLGRTIFVHQVDSLEDAIEQVHPQVQTIGVHPWSRGAELADRLALAGAARITEVGLMSRPRPGFSHDAMQPLHDMVRWVTLERGLAYKGRFRGSDRGAFERSVFAGGRDASELGVRGDSGAGDSRAGGSGAAQGAGPA